MTYAFGEPVYCPKDASDSQMDSLAETLRQSLLATSRLAGESRPLEVEQEQGEGRVPV